MKKTISLSVGLVMAMAANAVNNPLWLRDVAISPDGSTVAFTFKGDIFTVPVQGGTAKQITTSRAYDSSPIWSLDGKEIAFRSNREGTDDIYVIPSIGGTARRITTSSGSESPLTYLPDGRLLFITSGMPGRTTAQAPFSTQTYVVSTSEPNARPELYLSLPMTSANAAADGRLLYQDRKGYENLYRKHERSSGTADIWLADAGKFSKLTDFNGHDLNPVWSPDGTKYYYLSERDNNVLNVYVATLGSTEPAKRLTDYPEYPVRSLSIAKNGLLAYSYDGEIYTLNPGGQPQKVNVSIITDDYDSDLIKSFRNSGATTLDLGKDNEEVAFVVRGDVYVTSVKYPTTKRITNSPDQERRLSVSPDGRTIVYDSERNGLWQLFTAKIKNDDEKSFTYATDIVEEPLYSCETSAQQPAFSPDGKKVAFLENRTTLRVIDMDTKKVTTALDGKYNYSYTDGDISFEWSPDSKWLLIDYIGVGGWNNSDIALVKADGTEVIDLTESGHSDYNPKWALGGKAITYATGKYGMKSQGSWGNQSDVLLMVLDADAWDDFNMSEEEAALKEKENADSADKEKSDKKESKKKKKDKKDKKDANKDENEVKPLEFDLANRRYRMARLTPMSSVMGDYFLDPKGNKFYYETVNSDGEVNLMCRDLKKGDITVFAGDVDGSILPDSKGENLFVITDKGMKKINLADGKTEAIEFDAPYNRKPSLEREYIYDHMLHQVKNKFYDANLHGLDWDSIGNHYRRFLPYINNNRDFTILMSEVLGELNASHTGASTSSGWTNMPTATLGAYFNPDYKGDGLQVAELLRRGPLDKKSVGIEVGDIITAIDGEPILAGKDYNYMLEGKAGKKTMLTYKKAGSDKSKTVAVKPFYSDNNLLYQRWVENNEYVVDSLSGGRIGYVHVKGMDTPSYLNVYDRLLGKYRNCDAVIVDTRYNGGGWLHNDLAILLSGKEYVRFSPRGQYIGSEPFSQWTKPSVMLVNESNYSDAHGTPFVYQTLGIGDVIGAPVPGTMTAVWWESQIDPSIVFGIPQVTSLDMKGQVLENHQLTPDVIIYNTPEEILAGHDAQLVGSVKHLLEKLEKQK